MKKLKKIIEQLVFGFQITPPDAPSVPPGSIPLPPRKPTAPTSPPTQPPLNTPPAPPPEVLPIWPNPNIPIVDCENKPLSTSWPFPTPPIKGVTSDTDAQWQQRICSGIIRHYNNMRKKLDDCLGNCRNIGEEYKFEDCLRNFYTNAASAAEVMPYEYENELTQFNAPPQQQPRLSDTDMRSCEKFTRRCHCYFERKRWERKLESAMIAELYAAGCKPFVRKRSNNPSQQDRDEQERKKKFKEECDRVKKIFPFDSKCAKDGQGKYIYIDCKEACEKCGIR